MRHDGDDNRQKYINVICLESSPRNKKESQWTDKGDDSHAGVKFCKFDLIISVFCLLM